MDTKTKETVTVLTTQKDIWKKLNELTGTNNKFEIVFPPASSRSNFDPKTDQYPVLGKSSRKEKGYKLRFDIAKDKGMIGDSIFIPLKSIEKVTIGEAEEDGRKEVVIYHRLK